MPRCRGICQNGLRCLRDTRNANGFCYQHRAQVRLQHHAPQVRRRVAATPFVPQLRRLAANDQTVHDTFVNHSMLPMLDRLMATPVPPRQDTMAIVHARLADHNGVVQGRTWWQWICCMPAGSQRLTAANLRLLQQINDYYRRRDRVMAFGNYTYRTLLDHATALMERHPQVTDLWARFFEEMREAAGMCAHGIHSRLLNTFGGFYEGGAIADRGTLLQGRMSAIAAKTLPLDTKVDEARVALRELEVPEQEWGAWLDAF